MGESFSDGLCVCVCVLAMEGHGECEIKVQLNCSHCQSESCKRDEETHLILCLCEDDEVLAGDNVTCISAVGRLFHPRLAAITCSQVSHLHTDDGV